ncbi:hypothetical protein [Lichenifustis flavocetrariae]|uniref:Uncharacterized protein n=1 Tax=Lichenifustis flavocetrariae TaxID=2949735 RepID=A0AA42CMT3_9HYPH|nr:hypothetical protein [Lichenifustis flavocetrariae]MCW6508690.1 hypothetical protein [Lichenifustis flavocetrariae]
MILAQRTARRFLISLSHQMGLSVAGTLLASLLLSGLHAPKLDLPSRADALSERTSGGKLAARADAGAANQDGFVLLTALPLILPMFTAPSVPQIDLALPDADLPAAAAPSSIIATAWVDTVRPARAVSHIGAKRRSATDTALSVVPPRRADYLPVSLASSLDQATDSATSALNGGIWAKSKRIYQHVALWSGALLDRVVP